MTQWPHAPLHIFDSQGLYIVTASTLHKKHYFQTEEHLDILQNSLLELCLKYNWKLEAWAIFANHYHFIAQAPGDPTTLRKLISHLHTQTCRILNKLENTPRRSVWHEYWDTQLTFEKSYLARLNYVMNNPVRHRMVENAEDYRWCSMRWFNQNTTSAYRKVVSSFKIDDVNMMDDF